MGSTPARRGDTTLRDVTEVSLREWRTRNAILVSMSMGSAGAVGRRYRLGIVVTALEEFLCLFEFDSLTMLSLEACFLLVIGFTGIFEDVD